MIRIPALFIKFLPWESLKTVGNSYVSLFTIIVPIFGYLIFTSNLALIGVEQVLDFASRWGADLNSVTQESLIRLKMSYVGLSLVGFSTIVFQIFCPKSIKGYRDSRDFTLTAISVAHHSGLINLQEKLSKKVWYRYAVTENGDDSLNFNKSYVGTNPSVRARATEDSILKRSEWLEQNTDQMNKAFLTAYELDNLSLLAIRLPLVLGFTSGYILSVIPSIQLLWPPTKDVFHHLFG